MRAKKGKENVLRTIRRSSVHTSLGNVLLIRSTDTEKKVEILYRTRIRSAKEKHTRRKV